MPSQKGFSLLIMILCVGSLGVVAVSVFLFNKYYTFSFSRDYFYVAKKNKLDDLDYINPSVNSEFLRFYHPSKGFSFEYPYKWRIKSEVGDISGHMTDFKEDEKQIMNLTIIDSPLEVVKASHSQAQAIALGTKQGLREGNKILIPLGSGNTSVALMTFEDAGSINHIISTLQFEELAEVDDVQHWPIYEDKENGFSFPYPAIFKVEKFIDESGNSGVKLIYNNKSASGYPPIIPANTVFEAKVVKTSDKADVYGDKVSVALQKDPNYSDYTFMGITADQISLAPSYKLSINAKNSPFTEIFYEFIDLKSGVLEAKGYYSNTKALSVGAYMNNNILDSVIYKIKLQK